MCCPWKKKLNGSSEIRAFDQHFYGVWPLCDDDDDDDDEKIGVSLSDEVRTAAFAVAMV